MGICQSCCCCCKDRDLQNQESKEKPIPHYDVNKVVEEKKEQENTTSSFQVEPKPQEQPPENIENVQPLKEDTNEKQQATPTPEVVKEKTVYDQLLDLHNAGTDLHELPKKEQIKWTNLIVEEIEKKNPQQLQDLKDPQKKKVGKKQFWDYVEQITGRKRQKEEWKFEAFENEKGLEDQIKDQLDQE